MKYLQITSLLFLTNTIHAYYVNNNIYYYLTFLITIFSILNHGYNIEETQRIDNLKNIIKTIDKILAHSTFFYISVIDTNKIILYEPKIILCPIIVGNIYLLEYKLPKYHIILHIIFHICSVISIHIYLYIINYYQLYHL